MVAHSFASKTKFLNQKEAIIFYGKEVIIKLRNFASESSLTKIRQASKSLRWATTGLQTKIEHFLITLFIFRAIFLNFQGCVGQM